MSYVDGFVLPVPKKNIQAYRRMAQIAAKVWREHGALEYRECVGDDLQVKMGVPFPKKCKNETRRNRGVRVDRLQVARPSGSSECQSDEG